MTVTSVLIRDAFRESNLISITAQPTDDENTEALRLLNRLVASVYGLEAGEQLDPILIGRNNVQRPQGYPYYDQVPDTTDWYVPTNSVLVLNLTSPQTVYLDPMPDDGARFAFQDQSSNLSTNPLTVVGNGRTIGGGLTYTSAIDGDNQEFMYRQDIGSWVKVSPILSTDIFPFPEEFDDYFSIGLSMRLNPRNANALDPQSSAVFARGQRAFKARYRQHKAATVNPGLLYLTSTRRHYYEDTRYANSLWNSGYGTRFGAY